MSSYYLHFYDHIYLENNPVASQAERDHFRYMRTQTRLRVQRSCAGEMEREVHAVLGPVGVDEKLSRQVADSLLALEDEQALEEYRRRDTSPSSDTNHSESWLSKIGFKSRAAHKGDHESGLRWSEDVGLTAFLLKFGEGMGKSHCTFAVNSSKAWSIEEVPTLRLYISAFTIGMG